MKKRLNNKGFTLIELLAVVVILAVVMGIAMTSVLSAMNKSRAGALTDSAMVVANGFNQKYTESLVDGIPNNVYLDEIKKENATATTGYDFTTTAVYELTDDLATELKLSNTTYRLSETVGSKITPNASSQYEVSKSFVAYEASVGKFIICLVANNSGNNYVAANAVKYTDTTNAKLTPTINGMTFKFVAANGEADVMYSCNDGTKSW